MNVRHQSSNEITIAGRLDIENVTAAYKIIKATFDKEDTILLDVDGLSECDLTAVQLLDCVRRSAAAAGKSAVLSAPASGSLRAVLARGGFDRSMTADQSRFWFHTTGES